LQLAATSGSKEMLGLYFREDYLKHRCRALVSAAGHGDAEMVRFILDDQAGTSSWTFDLSIRYESADYDEPRALKNALVTPNLEICDIIMDLVYQHRVSVEEDHQAEHLL
jgi:hypothetical protein